VVCFFKRVKLIKIDFFDNRLSILVPAIFRGNSRLLYLFRESYDPSIGILEHFVFKGQNVVDVGAHFGVYSVVLSEIVGKEGSVFCYEPVREFCDVIQANISQFDISNIEVINLGLSNQTSSGVIKFHSDPSRTSLTFQDAHSQKDNISISTLNHEALRLPPISFVKIDAEGMDSSIVLGMGNLIFRDRPVIQFETLDSEDLTTISSFLDSFDYSILSFNEYCGLLNLPKIPKNMGSKSSNFYALPSNRRSF